MSGKVELIKNSLSGGTQFLVTALLTFVSIPVFINKLGMDYYGVFSVLSVIGNLNVFANLGLNTALTKYISEQGKSFVSDYDIEASLFLVISLIIPLSVIAYFAGDFLLAKVLHISLDTYPEARALYNCLLISNALLLIGQIFTAVLDGVQKMYLTNMLQMLYSVLYWGGLIVSVWIGKGLAGVGVSLLIAATSWFVISCFLFRSNWDRFIFRKLDGSFISALKKQLGYGTKVYMAGLVGFFNEPLFKVIVSSIFGFSAVAYLEIAFRVRGQVTGLFSKLLAPLFPHLSQMPTIEAVSGLISRVVPKVFFMTLLFSLLLLVSCPFIVELWLRQDIMLNTIFIVGIACPYMILSPVTLPVYLALIAKGHPEKTFWFQLSSVIVNCLMFLLLYKTVGLYTIIVSNVLSFLASCLLGIYYQHRIFHVDCRIPFTVILKVLSLIVLVVSLGLVSYTIGSPVLSLLWIVLSMPIGYFLLVRKMGFVSRSEMDSCRDYCSVIFKSVIKK